MKQAQVFSGIAVGGVVTLLTNQPAWAAAVQVTAVQINPRGTSLELILETQAGDQRPQIFSVNRGNDWVADIVNTRLNLPQGNNFRQDNPMPGIQAVAVNQLEPNSIRITVTGAESPPSGQILRQEDQQIALGISPPATIPQTVEPISVPPPTAEGASQTPLTTPNPSLATDSETGAALPTLPTPSPQNQGTNSPAVVAQIPAPAQVEPQGEIPAIPPPQRQTPAVQPPVPAPNPDVLVPNPRITIDGVPAAPAGAVQPVAPAPPFLPRAVAPPVGDISVSNINAAASQIDLGTAAVVPRLSLREAPVREVLSLLARSAGLNLAYTGGGAEGGGAPGAAPAGAQQTISLDLENEPVQDVFNYVLQLSGLQANRRGRTIFVGPQLPAEARNIVSRTLRLNQVPATSAANYLTAQGAETQIPIEQVQIQTLGEGAAARTVETRTPSILALRATETDAVLLLRGLSVVTDERLNAITLVGEPRLIEIASALLTQLDLRRRQVAINVKIVDVNLLGTDAFNTSFSFGVGDGFFVVDQGAAVFNYGDFRPPSALETQTSTASPTVIPNPFAGAEIFSDPNTTFIIPDAGPRTQIINRPGGPPLEISPPSDVFIIGGTPFVRLSDPLVPGITDITLPTDTIITYDQDGNPTVTVGEAGDVTFGLPSLFQYPKRFLAALQAQITSGNAKILTDPTLVVQEGQTAQVNLTQEVVGNITSETESSDNLTTRTVTAEIREAGLILNVIVDRIDDNGFITLAVNPTVTSIGSVQNLSVGQDTNQIALLNRRELTSGQIRLRDGQTLILAGIIQETDRTTVRKVPILGDIPILGALFRSTERQNQRQEVIVLLTPQIIDDSERSGWGYNYTPGRETREVLERRGFPTTGGN
ncbi:MULTISPECIES: AMIN domain-containing protein [unclassified Coleofasciculus]|uniref:AMIN domain-containing protein n=1 Tax=unclassified Coleofasciculus TaxID=2692782 RepID=UPI00187DE166|nr:MULTISPECIES: type IV pilus secretin family protein [unclassified Coleofasciculus]MBE9129674.1 AMIN domain-containing protein [Coleofasciculus sp. LEGE 07081]MBE9152197.1 AMIN domain-containing protein [Coleofasciculus sp. LEGE 07092]